MVRGSSSLPGRTASTATRGFLCVDECTRWLRCDPSTDRDLASRTCHFWLQTRLIDWATGDSLDFLDPAHVHADLGLYANVDELLDRPARGAGPELFAAGNAYLDFRALGGDLPHGRGPIAAYRHELDGQAAIPSRPPRGPLANLDR